VTLQCCTGISSFDRWLAIFATAVTVASFLYALWANRKQKTARQAADLAEARLLTYIAGTDFAIAVRMAYEVIFVVGARNWKSAHEQIAEMAKALAHAKGKWSKKLKHSEASALQTLETQIIEWPGFIPKDDSAPNNEQTDVIAKGCILAIQILEPIAARLGREILQRNGEE
jgi:hypothetical protein